MHRRTMTLFAALLGAAAFAGGRACAQQGLLRPSVWLTTQDRTQLLTKQAELPPAGDPAATQTISVDPAKSYQAVDGFGFALTGGSAQLIHAMEPAARHALLAELFTPGSDAQDGKTLGVSYLRVSIGASDMNDHVYTYDDVYAGKTDPKLKHFSLQEDEKDVIPVLKEILAIAPGIQIMATPWTAPSWMKTNGLPKGGELKPELYPVYAKYLVRYLKDMQAHGITITALSMQNEPLNGRNTPSLQMDSTQEGTFLRDALGPKLAKARLRTHVILFDHNCNHPDYPEAILKDPKAAQYADGSGFHLYEGDISAMSQVHDAFPNKNLYFTEQMIVERVRNGRAVTVADAVSRVVIGAMRNWSRNILLWNLAADPTFGPHTNDGGCPMCQGAITLDGNKVDRNIALYTIAHASRFVPPGSVRIASTETDPQLADVAWKTPQGRHVLLVTNTGNAKRAFSVVEDGQKFATALDAGSVATYVW